MKSPAANPGSARVVSRTRAGGEFGRGGVVVQRGQGGRMAGDLAGRRDPYIVSTRRDMREGPAQMPQTMGLADDIGMKRNAHDEGGVAALLEHFLELIDDHVGEDSALDAPRHDHGDIVEFLRIGHAENAPPARAEPDRLIVHAPVQQVGVARFLQQAWR